MPALIELSADESERLLRLGTVGRIVMTTSQRPEILPVNYAVRGKTVVVRITPDGLLARYGAGDVLFEVDQVDEERWHGWSVVARGRSAVVHLSPDEPEDGIHLRPWADGDRRCELRLTWDELTGRRIGTGWDLESSVYARRAVR
jgi:uncharacterized protein